MPRQKRYSRNSRIPLKENESSLGDFQMIFWWNSELREQGYRDFLVIRLGKWNRFRVSRVATIKKQPFADFLWNICITHKTNGQESFFNKVAGLRLTTLLKSDFSTGVLLQISWHCKNTFFTQHLFTTASDSCGTIRGSTEIDGSNGTKWISKQ